MSKDLQKSDNGSTRSISTKTKIGQGMIAGALAGLSDIELPRMFNQLVIFLLDGSGSMSYNGTSGKSKGHEVHQAVINVIERLKESKNKSSFDVAFWAYAKDVVQMFPIKSVKEVDLIRDCFNPCEYVSDYTRTLLRDCLENSREQAEEYLLKYKNQNTKVLIIILGDGAINDYPISLQLKSAIAENSSITFCSILFESTVWQDKIDSRTIEGWKSEFSKLASADGYYMSTVDIEKIRGHMIQSITKISKI